MSDGGLAGFAALSVSRSARGNVLSLLKQQQTHQSPGSGVHIILVPVAPSVPRAKMTLLPPVMQQKVHREPVLDILFTEEAIFTVCCNGAIKCWLKSHVAEEMASQLQLQQQQQQHGHIMLG